MRVQFTHENVKSGGASGDARSLRSKEPFFVFVFSLLILTLDMTMESLLSPKLMCFRSHNSFPGPEVGGGGWGEGSGQGLGLCHCLWGPCAGRCRPSYEQGAEELLF